MEEQGQPSVYAEGHTHFHQTNILRKDKFSIEIDNILPLILTLQKISKMHLGMTIFTCDKVKIWGVCTSTNKFDNIYVLNFTAKIKLKKMNWMQIINFISTARLPRVDSDLDLYCLERKDSDLDLYPLPPTNWLKI